MARLAVSGMIVAVVVGCWLRFGVGSEGEHRVLVDHETTLDRERPALEIATAAGPLAQLTVESLTGHSAALTAGTVVATVRIVRRDGVVERWPLRLGAETGEWAARRPELAGALVPAAWRCWVPASGSTFGQSYRARWRPEVDANRGGKQARGVPVLRCLQDLAHVVDDK